MRNMVAQYRWTSWLAAAALAFQVFALVLTTPMEVARGLAPVAAAADHCETGGHHGTPAGTRDLCQICIGMQVAGHAVAPVAPALPRAPTAPAATIVAAAIDAPILDAPRPQIPRAPPIPV